MIERWRLTLVLHRDSGRVAVRVVGVPAPAPVMSWAQAMREAVRLVGPGATVRMVVLVPAVSGTFRQFNEYRLQLPGGRAETARKREAAHGENRAA